MKTIYKYELNMQHYQILMLPKESEPLKAEFQNGKLCVWVLIPDTTKAVENFAFNIFDTGEEINPNFTELIYLDSVFKGNFVWHIFYE